MIRFSQRAGVRLPLVQVFRRNATSGRASDRAPTNEPSPPAASQNVSETNRVPVAPLGIRDDHLPLQENPEDSERQRVMQAPNRATTWSRSQQPREVAMSGPRFEQTMMKYQVCRLSHVETTLMKATTRSRHQPNPPTASALD